MTLSKSSVLISIIVLNLQQIHGHGMVMDPVNRGSAWRVGFDTPPNWTDNQNYCGGFRAHFEENLGKCGVCGDNYSDATPRDNEHGGTYGTGTIVRNYTAGSVIDAVVRITANHLGYFQFSICPLDAPGAQETEECFNNHLLRLSDGSDKYNVESFEIKDYVIPLVLPEDVTCEHCVFRWHYRVANSWGLCEDGTTAMGCGNQETFRSCSDISIRKK